MTDRLAAFAKAIEGRLQGPTFRAADSGYAPEIAVFNLAIVHRPDLVVGAASEGDVVEVLRAARQHGVRVAVQGGGHGAYGPLESGVLLTTRRLDRVVVDPESRSVTVGAGARWAAVMAAAYKHGLAPIAGSSPNVGVVGYLLGGGLGPLARSHGFGSDYLLGLRIVTGLGGALTVNAEENPDLFWALRGGKGGIGIVTEARVRLVPMSTLYAGSLTFDEPHIERALRAWVSWTERADPRVTTSMAIIKFPPLERVPEPLRGRRLLMLRFAYPGSTEEGHRLAAPLREFAPIYLDALGEMPSSDMARIHNDPENPVPSWIRGALLKDLDQEFVSALLEYVGAGSASPFGAAEIRHLGEATRRDVPGGSSVGGRSAGFAFSVLGMNPDWFERELPEAAERLWADVARWISPETTINYLGKARSPEHLATAWSKDAYPRLQDIRKKYDPDDILVDGH
jgi:FAD/FMN-containing dehydrogenase